MITGKNKEQFEKWYMKYIYEKRNDYHKYSFPTLLRKFYRSTFEMQKGIYEAYYDSLGLECMVKSWVSAGNRIYLWSLNDLYTPSAYSDETKVETRNEAYKEAFKKADELVNKEL